MARRKIEHPDGWTTILGPSRDGKYLHLDENSSRYVFEAIPLQDLQREFEQARNSTEKAELSEELQSIIIPRRFQIEHAICFGLGSFCRHTTQRGTSMRQLLAFMDICANLQKGGNPIQASIQDPVLTATDKNFLSSHGLEILDRGDGFEKITAKTFVFLAFIPKRLWRAHLHQLQKSPLFISPDVTSIQDNISQAEFTDATDQFDVAFEDMTTEREKLPFPVDEKHSPGFYGLKIYIKAQDGDDVAI
ncbi:MAG: hypothetical protein M1820_010201 [Bogoriella megaspora]|nr:MAG: hypothetical protein M1820_010201 [Bogoriella megaspora]